MANLADVTDTQLRSELETAHGQLRSNQPTQAVHTLSDAFLAYLERNPSVLQKTTPMRDGRQIPVVMRWPALGANLSMESIREGRPRIEFTRERFAMSEALTYYEFTVETALGEQS